MATRFKKANARDLVLRYRLLKDERTTWDNVWQEQVDYFVPNKAPVTTKRQKGAKSTEKLFDSTALDAVQRLTASMQGNLTPPPTKWFYLKMRSDELNEDSEVVEWLEDCAKRMRLAFNQSNFSSEIASLYADLIVFGTGFMLGEEKRPVRGKFGGLRFKAYSIGTYCIAEDHEGLVDTVFREFTLSARAAFQKWGEDAKKSERIRAAIETPSRQDTMFTFLHAVYPRDEYDDNPATPADRLPYASVYVCLDDSKLIREGGYHEFPGMAPRWSKSSDEIYGRGPGHIALADVKTINRAKELGLKAWAKEIDPPLKVLDQGVVGDVYTTPGGQTVVTQMDGIGRLVEPIRGEVNRFNLEILTQAIRAMLYADQLVLKESPQMTAEEVRARMELMQRILGPTLGRLEYELLNRMIERTFAIMLRGGALKKPPQVVLDAFNSNEADIDIEYEGPLARAQRNIEVEAIERSFQRRMVLLEAGVAEAFDTINVNKALRHMDKIGGVPESVLNDDEAAEAIAIARAGQAKAQADAVERAAAAKTAKDSADAAGKMSTLPEEMTMGEAAA